MPQAAAAVEVRRSIAYGCGTEDEELHEQPVSTGSSGVEAAVQQHYYTPLWLRVRSSGTAAASPPAAAYFTLNGRFFQGFFHQKQVCTLGEFG